MFSIAPLPELVPTTLYLLKQSGLATQQLVRWSETKRSPAVKLGFKSQLSHVLAMTLGKRLCRSEPHLPICEMWLVRLLPQGLVMGDR